jgi:hypothetical protein
MGLLFTIAAGPHQRSHSPVSVPRDSWHFTGSESIVHQTGGPSPRIYIPQSQSQSQSHIATDGQSVNLQIFITVWQLRLVFVGRPLWREDGSILCIRCRSLQAQSFSGRSPLGLATIFYCLRFETSLFVASYDSQSHGGGIRPRLHAGLYISKEQDDPVIPPCRNSIENTALPSNGPTLIYFDVTCSLPLRGAYRALAQQWTTFLVELFRLSALTSQYTINNLILHN